MIELDYGIARFALEARADLRAHTDSIANFDALDFRADLRRDTRDLVARWHLKFSIREHGYMILYLMTSNQRQNSVTPTALDRVMV